MRVHVIPINDRQIDAGIKKYAKMYSQIKSINDVYNLMGYANVLATQLRIHKYHTTARHILDDLYLKLSNSILETV